MRLLTMAALLWAAPFALAQTDVTAMSAAERAAFRAELRAYLLAHPDVIQEALSAARPAPYAAAAASDRALIGKMADRLFDPSLPQIGAGPVRLGFLTGDCPACDAARAELETLARDLPMRVFVVDDPALADRLALDTRPAYVFDDLIVRGHVPPVVIERYVRARLP